MTLTDQEYNFLMELSARTKMDCWFWIETEMRDEIGFKPMDHLTKKQNQKIN